jgi:predicted acetyltransferase
MRSLLDDARERAEPLSMLYSSETTIYGRFGYGHATTHLQLEIAPKRTRFVRDPDLPGEVVMLEKDRAGKVFPAVYDRARLQQPGAITRSSDWWEYYLSDPEKWRDGASARFYVLYESASGQPEGYLCYRIKDEWEHGIPGHTLIVSELMPVTDEAYAALWQYCLNVDLVEKVKAYHRPIDEPLRWMLTDVRRVRVVEVQDEIWARLVDISGALAARRYATEDVLAFRVSDEFLSDNTGCYRLEGGPQGARACRIDSSPDLELPVADLSATYLGGVRFSTLARAGRVVEHTSGALRRADLMFTSEPQAWCSTDF